MDMNITSISYNLTSTTFYDEYNSSSYNDTDYNISNDILHKKLRNITTQLYIYVVPILILICLISFVLNVKIVIASRWLRKPISPNLKINLSLAGADAYTSFCLGIGLFVNSWLPVLKNQSSTNVCPILIFEGLRLGGIITVVFHILFLSINHYAGIVRPLHYNGIVTSKYTNFTLVAIWIIPPTSFLIYFALHTEDGFNKINCGYKFLRQRNFRVVFSGLFLAPFTLMVYIYIHIFVIIRRHQEMRDRYARADPTLRRTVSTGIINTTMELQRNLKAICTTLLMLGSYLIGWLPGLVYFIIVCDDCYYSLQYFNPITTFSIGVVTNLFIILKTLLNPIIYASRISDIKVATLKMHIYLRNLWQARRNTRTNRAGSAFRIQDYSTYWSDCNETTTTRMI